MVDGMKEQGRSYDATPIGLPAADRIDRDDAAAAKPAAIRTHIEETRERMSGTLEEIGERLNPRHLAAQAKQNIRDATVGKVEDMARNTADRVNASGRSLVRSIRENPIPAAMVAVGLGWLTVNNRRQGSARPQSSGFQGTEPGAYQGGYRSSAAWRDHSPTANMTAGPEEEPGGLDRMRARTGAVVGDVKDKAGELAGQAQEAVDRAAHRAQDMASNVVEETRQQARRVEDYFYANPLAVGVVTLAAGIASGLAMPATRAESQLVGSARDQFVEEARATLEDTKDKVQHVAERVIEGAQQTASQAAREEGLTS